MPAAEFFFISASLGIWIAIVSWIFILYKVICLFTAIELEVKSVKSVLKLSGLALVSKLLSLAKGGDKHNHTK